MSEARHSHAGGVVVRVADGRREYLIVRAKRSPAWVLPKGHIEPGETPAQAAAREVAEEAGVAAEVVAPAGSTNYRVGREDVAVAWFLLRYIGEVAPGESRDRRWVTCAEARRMLTYDNLRELLARADAMPIPAGTSAESL